MLRQYAKSAVLLLAALVMLNVQSVSAEDVAPVVDTTIEGHQTNPDDASFADALHSAEDFSAELGHHDAAHDDSHGSDGLPQFDIKTFPSQLFWLAITFVIMFLTFSKRSLPAISRVLENRREHVQNDLEIADRLRTEADGVFKSYEKGLTDARNESSNTMAEALTSIKLDNEEMNAKINAKAEAEVAALEVRLSKATEEARKNMDVIAAEIAQQAASEVFGINTDLQNAQSVVQSLNSREAA
jgi:F-type H+-transporting ATPase subunit b